MPWTEAVRQCPDPRIEIQINTDIERTMMSNPHRGHEFVPGGGTLTSYFEKLGRDTDIGHLTPDQKVHIVQILSARHIARLAASVDQQERTTVEMAITHAAVSTTEWTLGRLASNTRRYLNQMLRDTFEDYY